MWTEWVQRICGSFVLIIIICAGFIAQLPPSCDGYEFGPQCECGFVDGCSSRVDAEGLGVCKENYHGYRCNFVCKESCENLPFPTCIESTECESIYLYQQEWMKR